MTREVVDLIREIESVGANRTAQGMLERIFDDILEKFKNQAYHSIYHNYVLKHGYPLSTQILENQFYLERKGIEKELRKYVLSDSNIIVLGCEGSGKTTLIHRVLGSLKTDRQFLYIETSDLQNQAKNSYFFESLVQKIIFAIEHTLTEEEHKEFEEWIIEVQSKNTFKKKLFDNDKDMSFIENLLIWMGVEKKYKIHLVLDNIDSLCVEAAQSVFEYLNQLHLGIENKINSLKIESRMKLKYIVSCRTPTYKHIASITKGMFVKTDPELVEAEDDIRKNISVPKLLYRFITEENKSFYDMYRYHKQAIPILKTNATIEKSFQEYVATIYQWLCQSEDVVNQVIKSFCGRSIRRMKIYGLRIFASPIIGMLANLEEQDVLKISRNDPKYLKRRLYESLFDFRLVGKLDTSNAMGFPLNIFKIVEKHSVFKDNPLIGIIGIDFLKDRWSSYAEENVYFAHCMNAAPFCADLKQVGYSDVAISDFFVAMSLSGILRPVPDSNVLVKSDELHRQIYSSYILDDRARDAYYDLLFCQNPDRSIQFFNAAVRYRYACGYYSRTDSFAYECLLTLVFLEDILIREKQLAEMNRDSGVAIRSFTGRIKGKILPLIKGYISVTSNNLMDKKAGGVNTHVLKSYDARVLQVCENLLVEVTREISSQEAIL